MTATVLKFRRAERDTWAKRPTPQPHPPARMLVWVILGALASWAAALGLLAWWLL